MYERVFIKAQQIKLMALFCCAFFSIKAQQNLILNGGFEDTLWCYPCGNFQITKFNNVTNPTLGSPDGYHYCCYNPVTFYPTRSRAGWGRIGIFTYQLYIPVKGLYTAGGGETNLIIGNFLDDANSNLIFKYPGSQYTSSYLTVDDVSLVPIDIDLGNDINICNESDSLLIGEPNWIETTYKWFANGTLMDTVHGQIKIKPNNNTTYVVQKQTSCTTTSDTLVVTYTGICPVLPTDITEPIIPNVFTPNGDINEYWRITLPTGAKLKELEVYNRWGNSVFISEGTIKPWFGRTSSGESCSEGVYFYVIKYTDARGEEQKKNGYISLFR